jgi:hypothetical protein
LDEGGVEDEEYAEDCEEGELGKKPRLFGGVTKNRFPSFGIAQRGECLINPISIHGILLR